MENEEQKQTVLAPIEISIEWTKIGGALTVGETYYDGINIPLEEKNGTSETLSAFEYVCSLVKDYGLDWQEYIPETWML